MNTALQNYMTAQTLGSIVVREHGLFKANRELLVTLVEDRLHYETNEMKDLVVEVLDTHFNGLGEEEE